MNCLPDHAPLGCLVTIGLGTRDYLLVGKAGVDWLKVA